MLEIKIPKCVDLFDEEKQEFIGGEETKLTLEHSLVSISKWEARWLIPFLSSSEKTELQILDYVRCMIVTRNVDLDIVYRIPEDLLKVIHEYINSKMTATTLPKSKKGGGREIITSELIYYWMVSHNIPFECQKWHLNRLLMLISVCNIKSAPTKKTSRSEAASRNRSINASRRKSMGTKG